VTAAGGAALGAAAGGMLLDLVAFGLQNLITQGSLMPGEQFAACCRLWRHGINSLGALGT